MGITTAGAGGRERIQEKLRMTEQSVGWHKMWSSFGGSRVGRDKAGISGWNWDLLPKFLLPPGAGSC